jgi:hypothetical protein
MNNKNKIINIGYQLITRIIVKILLLMLNIYIYIYY